MKQTESKFLEAFRKIFVAIQIVFAGLIDLISPKWTLFKNQMRSSLKRFMARYKIFRNPTLLKAIRGTRNFVRNQKTKNSQALLMVSEEIYMVLKDASEPIKGFLSLTWKYTGPVRQFVRGKGKAVKSFFVSAGQESILRLKIIALPSFVNSSRDTQEKTKKRVKWFKGFLVKRKIFNTPGFLKFRENVSKLSNLLSFKGKTWIQPVKSRVSEKLYDSFRDFILDIKGYFAEKKITKTPTFLQMEATECGSICLSIILAYYQHWLSPEEARSACGVSRDGSKASHIVRAARQFNMDAKGYSIKDLDDLDQCHWPCISHWNFDHFVVFEGRHDNYYYINDPNAGRRRLDHDEFNNNFTGVVLILKPEAGFVTRTQKNPLLEFLYSSIDRGKAGIAAAFFLSILQILPTLIIACAGKVFLDFILIKHMSTWLPQLILILIACVGFQALLLALHQRLLTRLAIHFKLSMESLLVHKLFSLPLRFFDQRLSGDILNRLSSADELSRLLSMEIMSALSNIFGIVVFTIVLLALSPSLFLIMFAFILMRIVVFFAFREKLRETNIHSAQQAGRVAGIEMNGLVILETLKANNMERVFFKNWSANHDLLLNKSQTSAMAYQNINIWLATLTALMSIGLLYRGIYLVMGESITIGTLMAFMTLCFYLDGPVMTVLDFSTKLEKIKASVNRFNDILRYEEAIEKVPSPPNTHETQSGLPELTKEIVLDKITFGYAPLDPPILQDLSLKIAKGKTTAIVGLSGSGKSTISKILCGLYPITTGRILWDKLPIENTEVVERNNRISLVDQDIFLFDGSVRDNLTSWEKNVEDADLIESLKLVGLFDEFLPRGLLNNHVGENGNNLSGGQRQRLEIARTLLRKTDVLILDEATSALDTMNEQRVFDSLADLSVTTVIIAHRLSTIQKADIIYVVHEGKVCQFGRHEELVKQTGIYQELVKLEVG